MTTKHRDGFDKTENDVLSGYFMLWLVTTAILATVVAVLSNMH